MDQEIEIPTLANVSQLPEYASEGASGADVRAHLETPLSIAAGNSALVPTGLFFEIPEGYEIQVRPRSGLAFKHQVTVLNTPGTIDADYRGELKVILINHGQHNFVVEPGMRIAQIVVAPVVQVRFIRADVLAVSERGRGGFGHTGVH
ncbi:MAG: Deoxyuridine 5'-triphosphate nucleotidohydrolase [Chlamydiales bacterium]|nr:Deoxyuridine 5'-triphosphate nucleotidohydrolase [Chlamydiales bacterium]